MADKNNVLFRNSVNGFNKGDVNSYIMKINVELEEAEKMTKDAKKEAEEIKSELENALLELEGTRKMISEQNSIISAQYENIDALKEKLAALSDNKNEGTDTAASEKAELYDKMSAQIGDVLIDAKKNADEYLSRAKLNISDSSKKALNGITNNMCEGVDGCYKEATAYMNSLQIEINRLLSDFLGKNRAMNERIKELHSSLSKNISDEINSISNTVHPYINVDPDGGKRSV